MTDMVQQPGWAVAFAAGVTSFLSPRVLPLAPSHLAVPRDLFGLPLAN